MNRRRLRTVPDAGDVVGAVVVCLACRLDFDGHPDAGHAAYFAEVHNDLHHGSAPVAFTAAADPATDNGPFGGDAA